MKKNLEYKDDRSAKFWSIEVSGNSNTVTYGKIGAEGTIKTKEFQSSEEALKDAEKLVSQKIKKGYYKIDKNYQTIKESDYRVISEEEAKKEFDIGKYINGYDTNIKVYDGNVLIPGNLNLDYEGGDEVFGIRGEETGIIVKGDLAVEGIISNYEWDFGPFLLVLGNLKAENILTGGSEIWITGNADIKNAVFTYYNHGLLTVEGNIKAKVIVCSDHFTSLNGKINAITISYGCNGKLEADFGRNDAGMVFINEVLDSEGYLDYGELSDYISSNKNFIRKGAKSSRLAAHELLDEIINSGQEVEEFDFTAKKLTAFPGPLSQLSSLKKLTLNDNNIEKIPAEIKNLANLEELYLHGCKLKTLPPEIGELKKLTVLDISGNELESIPDEIGNLENLRVLHIKRNKAPLPATISKLKNLEELSIRGSSNARFSEFPEQITDLKSLRILDISFNPFKSIPESISKLENLEELNMDHSLGYLSAIPNLTPLKNLKTLHYDGGMSNTEDPCPGHSLLENIFKLVQLEHLYIDRWGEHKIARKDLEALPPEIGSMLNLKSIDLSFCGLKTLPQTFYNLKNLEHINLSHNSDFSMGEIQKLTAAYPKTRINLQKINTRIDIDDDNFKQVNRFIKEGNRLMQQKDFSGAITCYKKALKLCTRDKKYSDYDRLYALYGKLYCIAHGLIPQEQEDIKRKMLVVEFEEDANKCLSQINEPIWHFTDFGAFQEEVLRMAYNGLSWYLYERTDVEKKEVLEKALDYAEKGSKYIQNSTHYYIHDTRVRVLLKLGRKDEAYNIVQRVLQTEPGFDDFQDIRKSRAYNTWLHKHSPSL
ncbi:MAG: WGR domain-containing protein [bacterium]|nr:WGR domain-containing protein [bacterium]